MFGRISPHIDPRELSHLLIQYVYRLLESRNPTRPPTQKEVGDILGVSQPFINNVLHGRKHFRENRYILFAKYMKMQVGDLYAELLAPHSNNDNFDGIEEMRDACDPMQSMLADYQSLCYRLYTERAGTLNAPHNTFCATRAFSALLDFVVTQCHRSKIQGHSAALVSIAKDGGGSVLWTDALNDEHPQFRRSRVTEVPPWMTEYAREAKESSDRGCIYTELPGSSESDKEWYWLGGKCEEGRPDKCRVAVQHVFDIEGVGDNASHESHYIVFTFDGAAINEERHSHLSQTLFMASQFGRQISVYLLEDRLRLAGLVHKAQLWRHQLMVPATAEYADLEPMEMQAQKFLELLCGGFIEEIDVMAADIWTYKVSENQFVSLSEDFRCVAPLHAGREIDMRDGTKMPLKMAYDTAYSDGYLTPRSFGRTTYMVANEVATITSPTETTSKVIHWSSVPHLELGTFIGVPFMFAPYGDRGPRHISVLYVRCSNTLNSENYTAVISKIARLMRKMGSRRMQQLNKRGGEWVYQEVETKEIGKMYEVFRVRKKGDAMPTEKQNKETNKKLTRVDSGKDPAMNTKEGLHLRSSEINASDKGNHSEGRLQTG